MPTSTAKNPFFFRLEPSKLLAELIQISMPERGDWITQVALDLANGNPQTTFAQSLFNEAYVFQQKLSERNRNAGLASANKRSKKSTNVNKCSTSVDKCSTSVNESQPSSSSSTETKDIIPYKEIIDDLNGKGGFRYTLCDATKKHIHARFVEGFTKDDFFHVNTAKIAEWKNTTQEKYLRPETLYGGKFQGYVNQPLPKPPINNGVIF